VQVGHIWRHTCQVPAGVVQVSDANVKYEQLSVLTETPRQRWFGRIKTSVYLAIVLALFILSVIGGLNPMIGT
jgi:hypothetical protein